MIIAMALAMATIKVAIAVTRERLLIRCKGITSFLHQMEKEPCRAPFLRL
jgi:hypothetical protein